MFGVGWLNLGSLVLELIAWILPIVNLVQLCRNPKESVEMAKQFKLVISFLFLFSLLSICFFPTNEQAEAETEDIKVKSIYLTDGNDKLVSPDETISLRLSRSDTLYAYISCENGKAYNLVGWQNVEWQTSDPQVVTVSDNGELQGVEEGTAVITVTYKGFTSSVEVRVITVTALTASLDKDTSDSTVQMKDINSIVMEKGSVAVMQLTASYNDGSQQVETNFAEWDAENPDIAFIGSGGNSHLVKIISMKEGITAINASLDGMATKINVEVISVKELNSIPLEPQISVKINGMVQIYDQPPVIRHDRTLVPLRGIFEALGASVIWDSNSQTITAIKDDTLIKMKIGNSTALKNGSEIFLDVPAELINDRTMVPVRFISEALGAKVDWDGVTNTVLITTE